MTHDTTNAAPETVPAAPSSELERAIGALERYGLPVAGGPDHLPLEAVCFAEDVFNVRGDKLDEYHLGCLGRALAQQGELTPVLVVAFSDRVFLIDGHHRLEAYRRGRQPSIPVEYFTGSLREAVLEAARRNGRTVLPLSNRQRQDLAWRLVNADFTLKQVSNCTGISRAQVGIMRRVKKALGGEAVEFRRWGDARRTAEGKELIEYTMEDREAKMEEWTQAMADRLRRAFSDRLVRQPEITAGALVKHFGRRLPDLYRALGEYLSDEDRYADYEGEF